MRIVRERGCQVAQVARLDVDRWATAWAATSVAPGGGRSLPCTAASPSVFLFLAFSTGPADYHQHRPRVAPAAFSLPPWLLVENSKRPFHFGPSPGRLTPGTHVTHPARVTRVPSLAIIAYISLSTSSCFATLTGALQSPARTIKRIYIYIYIYVTW